MNESLTWLRDPSAAPALPELLSGLIRDIRLILVQPDLGNAAKLAAITSTVDQLAPPPGPQTRAAPIAAAVAALLARRTGPYSDAARRHRWDAWSALGNGDEAHDMQATGMLGAIVAPLAAGGLPVWVVSSCDGDLVPGPIGWMRLARCCRRPTTESGGDRDVGQWAAYCRLSIVTPGLLVENPRRLHLPCPSALTEPQKASPPGSVWCPWPERTLGGQPASPATVTSPRAAPCP